MTNGNDQTNYTKRIATALNRALDSDAGSSAQNCQLIAKVGMRRQDSLLYVALEFMSLEGISEVVTHSGLDSISLLTLVHRSLIDLKADLALDWIKLVKVSGRLSGQSVPLWQEDLLLSSAPPIAKTLMRPEPPPMLTAPADMGDVSVQIGGNMSGHLIIGHGNQLHNYTYNVAHGGVLNVAAAPTIKPRPTPLEIRPRAIVRLLNRQMVLPTVQDTLNRKLPIEVYAEAGFGKTALMQHIAHESCITDGFADGVVYLPVGKQPAADLLQSLYDQFYEASPPFKPSYAQVQHALKEKQALVILNGLSLDREEGEWLLTALPNCTFSLVSESRIYWQDGAAIALKGLPFPESIALIQIELGRALSEAEQVAVKALWTVLLGNPLQLRRAAAQVKEKDQSFVALVQSMQATAGQTISGRSLFQKVAARLSPRQQKVLAFMGAMGGVALNAEQSQAMSQVPDTAEVLNELAQMHLVDSSTGSGYQLSADLIEWVPQSFAPQIWLARATHYFTDQGANVTQPSSSEAMMHLLEWTQDTGQWQQSLALTRRLDPSLALSGQWQQWQQALTYSLQAAEHLSDGVAKAWSLHQLGTRSLAVGETAQAETLLTQALRLREQIGDTAGAAVTRHNLGLILPPLVAGESLVAFRTTDDRSWLTRWPEVVAGVVLAGSVAIGLALLWPPEGRQLPTEQLSISENVLDFGPRQLRSASDPRGVTLTNEGKKPLQLIKVTLTGSDDFKLSPSGDCRAEVALAPGDSCELLAVFSPTRIGDRTANIIVEIGKADALQFHKIALSGTGRSENLPSLRFDTPVLDFGATSLKERVKKTFKITNDGTAPLKVSAFNVEGEQASEYGVISENCKAATLAPKTSCSVELWFEPGEEGDRTAILTVKSNVGDDSKLSLKGVGVGKKPPSPPETSPPETSPPESNKPPVANDDSATVLRGESVEILVLTNDLNPAGGELLIESVGSAQAGEITISDNTTIIYRHYNPDMSSDRFTYKIKNSAGDTAEATVTITVKDPSPPSPPVANDDSATVEMGSSVAIPVLENDLDPFDPNKESLRIIDAGPGEIGTTEISGNQIIYYTNNYLGSSKARSSASSHLIEPSVNLAQQTYENSDSFTYTIANRAGETAQATVFISIVEPSNSL